MSGFSIVGVWFLSIASCMLQWTITPSLHAQFDPATRFRHFSFDPSGINSPYEATELMQDSRGNLWIGSDFGLHRYDGDSVKSYFHSNDSSSISGNEVLSIYEDRSGRIWLGTRGHGLDLYDPVHDNFNRYYDPLRHDLLVWCFFQPDPNTLWIGSRHYLIQYNLETNTCDHIPLPAYNGFNVVRDIRPDAHDPELLWLATRFGLMSFDTRTQGFSRFELPPKHFRVDPESEYFLLMDLYQSQPDEFWFTTWGSGMVNFSISKNQWQIFKVAPPREQQPDWQDVILDMSPLNDTLLWIASSVGFGTFNIHTAQYSFFDEGEEPQLQKAFSYSGICGLSDGRMAIGMQGGFDISEPIFNASSVPGYRPVIEQIEVDGHPFRTDSSSAYIRSITLDEDQKDIAFSIASPGYFDDRKLIYNYKLEGYDKDWQKAHNNEFRYTNLNAGEYELRFRISTGDENWIQNDHPLRITKTAHFWERPLSYLIMLLAFLVILGAVYLINIRSIKRTAQLRSEYDKKIARVEMAALRAQMNPHFMFNSLNSIKAYILKERTDEASEYITKFSRLMRAVLRNSKSPLVTLEDEMGALTLYVELESLRFEGEFKYQITIDESIDTQDVMIPPLLIQPYVENAIRHGLLEKEEGQKLLKIAAQRFESNDIVITIEDNGVGRGAAAKRKPLRSELNRSFGMEITGDRIALIEQTLGIHANVKVTDLFAEGLPAGTRVELCIPYIPVSESFT